MRDHCIAIDLILHSNKYGEIYNIGGHNEHTTKEIASIILHELGIPKSDIEDHFVYIQDREANDMRYAIAPDKITKELGWEPSVSFEEGIKFTIAWYKQNKDWLMNILYREKGSYQKRFDFTQIDKGLDNVEGAMPNFLDKFRYSHEREL